MLVPKRGLPATWMPLSPWLLLARGSSPTPLLLFAPSRLLMRRCSTRPCGFCAAAMLKCDVLDLSSCTGCSGTDSALPPFIAGRLQASWVVPPLLGLSNLLAAAAAALRLILRLCTWQRRRQAAECLTQESRGQTPLLGGAGMRAKHVNWLMPAGLGWAGLA